ncbi:MAG: hypothetical protein EA397_04320 [Deltaproteobacteria bacterium]|nr:MAG: hypothetical protein EA397_04320 [Deltaproteobacteria bacterium]
MDPGYIDPPPEAQRWFDASQELPSDVVFIPQLDATGGFRLWLPLAIGVVLLGLMVLDLARNGVGSVGGLVGNAIALSIGLSLVGWGAWEYKLQRDMQAGELRYGIFLGPEHYVSRYRGRAPRALARERIVGFGDERVYRSAEHESSGLNVRLRRTIQFVDPEVSLGIDASILWRAGKMPYLGQLDEWLRESPNIESERRRLE